MNNKIIEQYKAEIKGFINRFLPQDRQQFKEFIEKHLTIQISQFTKQISKENINQKQELEKHLLEQITIQISQFTKQISKENINQKQELEKHLLEHLTIQISQFTKPILEEIAKHAKHYENLLEQTKKQNAQYIKQSKIEKLEYIKQNYEQNYRYLIQNKQILRESFDKVIERYQKENEKYLEDLSEMGKQDKKFYEDMMMKTRKQISDTLTLNRQQNSASQIDFFNKSKKQLTELIEQISKQAKQTNIKFLEQIVEQTNNQISGFIEQISEKNNQQNSIFIKQNTELIRQLSQQSIINHGTINEKFEALRIYQVLSAFRENLITIKTSMLILEKLDDKKFKITYKLYLKYQDLHSEIPVLDITRGMIIIKLLFPPFFKQMLNNLVILKSQFDDKTNKEMTDNIKECDSFFRNFKRESQRMSKIKSMLDSNIVITDNLLTKLIKV